MKKVFLSFIFAALFLLLLLLLSISNSGLITLITTPLMLFTLATIFLVFSKLKS